MKPNRHAGLQEGNMWTDQHTRFHWVMTMYVRTRTCDDTDLHGMDTCMMLTLWEWHAPAIGLGGWWGRMERGSGGGRGGEGTGTEYDGRWGNVIFFPWGVFDGDGKRRHLRSHSKSGQMPKTQGTDSCLDSPGPKLSNLSCFRHAPLLKRQFRSFFISVSSICVYKLWSDGLPQNPLSPASSLIIYQQYKIQQGFIVTRDF